MRVDPETERRLLAAAGAKAGPVPRLPGPKARGRVRRPAKLAAPSLAVEVVLPLVTRSEINHRCWRARSRRTQLAKQAWAAVTRPLEAWDMLPCTVRMVRLGGRKLDDDNLRGAMKAARDHVAADLAVDDADERVTWEYGQEPGSGGYGVRITITKEF